MGDMEDIHVILFLPYTVLNWISDVVPLNKCMNELIVWKLK